MRESQRCSTYRLGSIKVSIKRPWGVRSTTPKADSSCWIFRLRFSGEKGYISLNHAWLLTAPVDIKVNIHSTCLCVFSPAVLTQTAHWVVTLLRCYLRTPEETKVQERHSVWMNVYFMIYWILKMDREVGGGSALIKLFIHLPLYPQGQIIAPNKPSSHS